MKKTLIAVSLIAVAATAQAQTEYFLGLSVGQSRFASEAQQVANDVTSSLNEELSSIGDVSTTTTVSQDRSDTGFKLYGGGWLDKNLGFEIGYTTFGESKFNVQTESVVVGEGEIDVNSSTRATLKANAFYVSGLIGHQFENKSRLFGKLGVYRATTKLNISGVATSTGLEEDLPIAASDKKSNSNVVYGIGYSYPIAQNIDLRAELERFSKVGGGDLDKRDIDLFSIGLNYRY